MAMALLPQKLAFSSSHTIHQQRQHHHQHRHPSSTLLCLARIPSNNDNPSSNSSLSSDCIAKPRGASSSNSPRNPLIPALFAKSGVRSALYKETEDYVLIEPGQDEVFVSLEELRARLKSLLENWPGDILPADLASYPSLDEAVTYLVESVCELDIGDGTGTVQWFQVQLE